MLELLNVDHEAFDFGWFESLGIHEDFQESGEYFGVQVLVFELIIFKVKPNLGQQLFHVNCF